MYIGSLLSKKHTKDTVGDNNLASKMSSSLILSTPPIPSEAEMAMRLKEDQQRVQNYV